MKANEIKVEIEITPQIHEALKMVANLLFDESGIKITSANFVWAKAGLGPQDYILTTVSFNTEMVVS